MTQTFQPRATARMGRPERGRRLALAVAGVDQHQRRRRAPGRPLAAGPPAVRRHRCHLPLCRSPAGCAPAPGGPGPPRSRRRDRRARARTRGSAGDDLLGQDRRRRAGGRDPAAVEQHQLVGELAGQGQVVHGADHGQVQVVAEGVDQLEHLLLVADVQAGGRLVQQQHRRLLGQGPGQHGPLALAAAERVEPAGGEAGQVEVVKRPRPRSPGRAGTRCRRWGCSGVRPSSTYSVTVIPAGTTGRLGDHGDPPGQLAGATARARRRPPTRIAPRQGTSPAMARSRVVLPDPLGPIRPSRAPPGDVAGQVVQHRPRRRGRPTPRCSSMAVTRPAGRCAGPGRRRAPRRRR